jgi:hypothetical protein
MSRFLTKILNERPGEIKPKLEVVPKVDQSQPPPLPEASQTSPEAVPILTQTNPDPNPLPNQTQTKDNIKQTKTVAPEKDFNKRANSLERMRYQMDYFLERVKPFMMLYTCEL